MPPLILFYVVQVTNYPLDKCIGNLPNTNSRAATMHPYQDLGGCEEQRAHIEGYWIFVLNMPIFISSSDNILAVIILCGMEDNGYQNIKRRK